MTTLQTRATLDLELDAGWLTVWFNQPDLRNPLTAGRVSDLSGLCAELQERSDIRGVVVRGRGGVFCAGGDLKSFRQVFQGGADAAAVIEASIAGRRMFDAVAALPQLTVVAIEGAAMAGGFGLACIGDIVLAERGARFALTETTIGLVPAQIAPYVLQRLDLRVGRRLMLLAESVDAETALRIGLVDAVVDGAAALDAALAALRKQANRCAPGAIAETKRLVRALPRMTGEQQMQEAARCFAQRMLSDEGREGIASFFEKRKPNWTGA
ncbi:MAG: enoyl-CoA hydratase-related protein [Rubrivivax sp.]|nr:enoyl-CoA hydratase-related protein [Rubrivivax sp.]